MHRVRITIRHNPTDPIDDLRVASRIRRRLWAHTRGEIDPDSPRHATQRDEHKNAFFEFATDRLGEVERFLHEYGHANRATTTVVQEGNGTECLNCKNITPTLTTVCPFCNFRDIDACFYCNTEIPRLEYISISGELFKCPKCHRRVRLRFQDQPVDSDDDCDYNYKQPIVLVGPGQLED